MAQLEKMTAKQLNTWIRNLQDSIKDDSHPGNQKIYKKWLEEALDEKQARFDRKINYIRWKVK